MKFLLRILVFILLPLLSRSQQYNYDSLQLIFNHSNHDSVRYKIAILLYDYYEELNSDSAVKYATQSVDLSRKNNKLLNLAYSLNRQAYQEKNLCRYDVALNHLLEAFSIAQNKANENLFWEVEPLKSEKQKRLYVLSTTHHIFALLMRQTGNNEQEIAHFKEAKRIADEINNPGRSLLGNLNLGRIYMNMGRLDSALYFENEGERIARNSGRKKYLPTILFLKGSIFSLMGDTTRGLHYLYESVREGKAQNNNDGLIQSFHALANYHMGKNNRDSSLYYALLKLETIESIGGVSNSEYHIGTAYETLYHVYHKRNQFDSAYKYLQLAHHTTDSINKTQIKSLAQFQGVTLAEQQRMQNIEKQEVIYRNKVRTNIMLAGIALLLLLAIFIYRNNLQKQKAKIKIEQAYHELRATQDQLIQSEKMASLGELTAGIAHEIQNPLNFVNNFSDVSNELVDEMNQELASGNVHEAKEIAADVKVNLEKILLHGRRADAIVKGMLQHSRSGRGQKEPTDLNALTEEYIRLAFHGWRAKDKSFNATYKTDLDNSIGKVPVVAQDISRVLLNLLNNAFYAVHQKKLDNGNAYDPLVTISTKKIADKVEVRVADNGNGIPKNIEEKIFQPFFTTKPTGQGTGLGLSLAYDIVKAHGGELKVETKEGEGSNFVILLPC